MTKIQTNLGNIINIFLVDTQAHFCIMSKYAYVTCSGFGFVTYKTVESAKKAIDDPQRILGVRRYAVLFFPACSRLLSRLIWNCWNKQLFYIELLTAHR